MTLPLLLAMLPSTAFAQDEPMVDAAAKADVEANTKAIDELGKSLNTALKRAEAAEQAAKASTEKLVELQTVVDAQAAAMTADKQGKKGPKLDLMVFADAYGSFNTAPVGNAYSTTPFHRAYAHRNGFSLSFAGVDAAVEGEQLGATLSLRFGPSVPVFFGGQPGDADGPLGLENVFQAYGTWQPSDALTIDLGQFGTIYGAEVAESWSNLNYTRGALYFAMQPFWHTGLRANYAFSEEFSVTALVVNGVNNAVDENGSPSIGLQAAYSNDTVSVVAGYLGALDPETSADGFHHFGDVVATVSAGDASIVFNGDIGVTQNAGQNGDAALWYGVSLGAGYALTEQFGIAARGEYLVDADNILYGAATADAVTVGTGTFTLDFKPVKDSDNVVLRWDNRFEGSNNDILLDRDGAPTSTWFSSTVGLVVKSK